MSALDHLLESLFGHRRRRHDDHHDRHTYEDRHYRHHYGDEEPIVIPPPGYPARQQYRICPSCRRGNHPASAFCQACGTSLTLARATSPGSCPKCGDVNAADPTFCIACGARLQAPGARLCSGCDARLAPDASFCSRCGQAAPPASS